MLLTAALLLSTSGAPVLTQGTAGAAAVIPSARDATLTEGEIRLHRQTALLLYLAVEETFGEIAKRIRAGTPVTEADAAALLEARLKKDGLVHAGHPMVAVNAHAVDPLFEPTPEKSTALRAGDVVVIDVWAKRPGGAYANLVWTAWVGARGDLPQSVAKAWKATRDARDAALAHLKAHPDATGDALDAAARKPLRKAKLERFYERATARPLGADDPYAPGAIARPGESRPALPPSACVSVEPGLYRKGEFATRTSANVCRSGDTVTVTTSPLQREIRALLD